MALITCPECSREISDKADACFHCGCPIDKSELPKVTCRECKHVYPANKFKCPNCFSNNSEYIHIVETPTAASNSNSIMTLYPGTIRCKACDFVYPVDLPSCRACNAINDQKPIIGNQQSSKSPTTIEPDASIICPKCKAKNAYNAGSKGFGLGKAAIGGVLIGPVGLLGGLIGSNKTVITCLKCNHKWCP